MRNRVGNRDYHQDSPIDGDWRVEEGRDDDDALLVPETASAEKHKSFSAPRKASLKIVVVSVSLILLICGLVWWWKIKVDSSSRACAFYFGDFRGTRYYNVASGSMGKTQCLVESKWLRLSLHSVRLPGTKEILNDWLWIDYHDRVNVLVEASSSDHDNNDEERQFWIFEQSKYALEGRSSLAIVGGIVEPGEAALEAAQREVKEEMHVECSVFHSLGRYRTDVNRGMGWVHGFWASNCKTNNNSHLLHQTRGEEIGAPDTERQNMKRISLSALKKAVVEGRFIEVQWTATVSLALLHPEMMRQDDRRQRQPPLENSQ